MYDSHGNPVEGRLNTDRPNYLKLQGSYDLPWGTIVGLNWYARSGALFSKGISYQGYGSVWYDGRGSMGRTPVEQATDLYLQHDIKLGGTRRVNLNVNISNLFDNDVATAIYTTQYRDTFLLTPVESFFAGFDPVAIATANSRIRQESVPRQARHPPGREFHLLAEPIVHRAETTPQVHTQDLRGARTAPSTDPRHL
jgi:hypothetical protein